jgi:citrate lyase subunit beta/citryl-CoA lyase
MDFVSAYNGAIPAAPMQDAPGQSEHRLAARAKLEVAAACHARAKVPSHNVTTGINDTCAVTGDAERAVAQFDYVQKRSIHLDQLKPVQAIFPPGPSDAHQAYRILTEAQSMQRASLRQFGKLHVRTSCRVYRQVLKRAKSSGISLPESIISLS